MKGSIEEALFKALESPEEFIGLVLKNQSRTCKSVLKSLLSKCKPKTAANICEAICKEVFSILDALETCSLGQGIDPQTEEPDGFCTPSPPRRKRQRRQNSVASKKRKEPNRRLNMLESLRSCALLAYIGMSYARNVFHPNGLFPAVRRLHDMLVSLEDDHQLQELIALLCELWWKENYPSREALIAQALPFVLSKSLASNRKADVHRVYLLRDALSMFDFVDESIKDLKHLLIRCVIAPTYLHSPEGRKFISLLFRLNPQLVKELTAVMRSQIPFGRRSLLEVYGEILYRAWKGAEGECLHEIEHSCLQGLVEGAVYASSKTLSWAVRKVFEGFTCHRAEPEVESMLFRLQEPILFRSLQVANSNVRRNALLLLLDLFPLQDPDASREEKEALLERQFVLIEKLLFDPCPDIRATSIEGICRILNLFWEVVPSATTVKFLSKIVDQMKEDKIASVRVAVLEGMKYLLENPQSHSLLKEMLPLLNSMIQDPSSGVRRASAELLLAIKDIREIQFHKVVHLDTLLSSLAHDGETVARCLTRLLLPSYFPLKAPIDEVCTRCLTLIKRSPSAGARFCGYALTEGAPAKSLLELVKRLVSSALPSSDTSPDIQEGVCHALSQACLSLGKLEHWRQALGEILSGELLNSLLKGAPTSRARVYILKLASFLPPKHAPELVKYCGQLVMNCIEEPPDLSACDEIKAVHSFVLAWGGFEDLMQSLKDILLGVQMTDTAEPTMAEHRPVKRSKRCVKSNWPKLMGIKLQKGESGDMHLMAAAGAAWHVQSLLAEDETCKALLTCGSLKELFSCLRDLVQVSMRSVQMGITIPGVISVAPITAFTNLSLHLALEDCQTNVEARTSNGKRKGASGCLLPLRDKMDTILTDLTDWTEEMMKSILQKELDTFSKQGEGSASSVRRKSARRKTVCNEVSSNSGAHSFDKVMAQTLRMTTAFLCAACESLTLELITRNATKERCLKFACIFFKSALISLDERKFRKEMKEALVYLRTSATYAAKLVHLCLKCDDGTLLPDAVELSHYLFHFLALSEQYEELSSISLLSTFRQWMPELISVAMTDANDDDFLAEPVRESSGQCSSSKISPNSDYWLSHVITIAFNTMKLEPDGDQVTESCSNQTTESGEPDKSPSNKKLDEDKIFSNAAGLSETNVPENLQTATNGRSTGDNNIDFTSTLVRILQKGNTPAIKGFINSVLRYAIFGMEYKKAIGSTDLLCSKLLTCKPPPGNLGIGRALVTGLQSIDCFLCSTLEASSLDEVEKQKLQRARNLIRIVIADKEL